jgi:hypothetical protein
MAEDHLNNSIEVWKPIPDWPEYDVSNYGNVRSYRKFIGHKWIIAIAPQKILKPGINNDGYLNIVLSREGQSFTYKVHQLVLLAFVGPCPPGHECRHIDGIRNNCHLKNLTWGTHSENMLDKFKHGYTIRGTNNPHVKLTDEKVVQIRKLADQNNYSQRAISRMFGIAQATAWAIINRKIWIHLP